MSYTPEVGDDDVVLLDDHDPPNQIKVGKFVYQRIRSRQPILVKKESDGLERNT